MHSRYIDRFEANAFDVFQRNDFGRFAIQTRRPTHNEELANARRLREEEANARTLEFEAETLEIFRRIIAEGPTVYTIDMSRHFDETDDEADENTDLIRFDVEPEPIWDDNEIDLISFSLI